MGTIRDDDSEPLVSKVLNNDKYIERQNKMKENQKYNAMTRVLQNNIDVAKDNFFKRTDDFEYVHSLVNLKQDQVLSEIRANKSSNTHKKSTKSFKPKNLSQTETQSRVHTMLDQELDMYFGMRGSEI